MVDLVSVTSRLKQASLFLCFRTTSFLSHKIPTPNIISYCKLYPYLYQNQLYITVLSTVYSLSNVKTLIRPAP
jgi:hypothetical protein